MMKEARCFMAIALLLQACSAAEILQLQTKRHYDADYTVHVVFSNHLDVGYTKLDHEVINDYFHAHFPRAVSLAEQLRQAGLRDRFIYTTQSWLVSLYLECPPNMGLQCPDADAVAGFRAAIQRGDISWHAFPFNAQAEVYSSLLFESGINLTHNLDDAMGLPRKIMMSQRDIPGTTRAVIPLLSRLGVRGLSIGVNAASAPPAVPFMQPFVWRDVASSTELVAMWHPGGYGGKVDGVNVDSRQDCILHERFNHALCVAWRDDNIGPPDSLFELGEMFMHLRDEFPGATVVASTFDDYLNQLLPVYTTLNLPVVTGEIGDTWVYGTGSDPLKVADFRAAMRAHSYCLTAGSCQTEDPGVRNFSRLLLKVGEHTWGLAIQTLEDWASWSNDQLRDQLDQQNPNYLHMIHSWKRQAAYVTWALEALDSQHCIVQQFNADKAARQIDSPPWPAMAFRMPVQHTSAPRHHPVQLPTCGSGGSHYMRASQQLPPAASWQAGGHLQGHGTVHLGLTELLKLQRQHSQPGISFSTKFWDVVVDIRTGCFKKLQFQWPADGKGAYGVRPGVDWGGADSELGLPVYSTYQEEDFLEMLRHYSYSDPAWEMDFSKFNASSAHPRRVDLKGKLQLLHVGFDEEAAAAGQRGQDGGAASFATFAPTANLRQAMPAALSLYLKFEFDSWAVDEAGAPQQLWLVYRFLPDLPAILLDLTWFNKTATRLPEALWLKFKPGPAAVDRSTWVLHKLDSLISPSEVILNGSHSLHCVSPEGAPVQVISSCAPGSPCTPEQLSIFSYDVGLLSPGLPTVLPNPDMNPDMTEGVSWNLLNNAFGTNFVMWYPYNSETSRPMRMRFRLQVSKPAGPGSGRGEPQTEGFAHSLVAET